MLKNETERNLTLFEVYILFSSVPLLMTRRVVLLVGSLILDIHAFLPLANEVAGRVIFPLMFSTHRERGSPCDHCP